MTVRRYRDEQTGFTLVELLVVLIILGVIGGVVTTAVVTSLRSSASTTSRVLALDELQTAMQRVTRDLRAAERIIVTDSTAATRSVTVEVFRAGSLQRVTYEVQSGSGADPDVLVRVDTGQTLITLVDNGAEPVFTYLDGSGEPLGDCASTCAEEYLRAEQIQVRFVRGIEGRSPVIVESLINVRNTRYEGGAL